MGKPKEEELTTNRDKIQIQTQKLMIAILEKANRDMEDQKKNPEKDVDMVRILGTLEKATKFLALEHKIDEGDDGEGLQNL